MVKHNNKKNNKKVVIIGIVSTTAVALGLVFLVIAFVMNGGFDGLKTRRVWVGIEGLLNQYTNDDYHIVSQDGGTSTIAFDGNGRLDFNCWEPSIFNMGLSKGTYCSFEFYLGDGKISDKVGGYYMSKHKEEVEELATDIPGIRVVTKREDYYMVSFADDASLKTFFLKVLEIDDFKGMWEIYKSIIAKSGKINVDVLKVDDGAPWTIINPNGLYVDVWKNGHYWSLFDYAYDKRWGK